MYSPLGKHVRTKIAASPAGAYPRQLESASSRSLPNVQLEERYFANRNPVVKQVLVVPSPRYSNTTSPYEIPMCIHRRLQPGFETLIQGKLYITAASCRTSSQDSGCHSRHYKCDYLYSHHAAPPIFKRSPTSRGPRVLGPTCKVTTLCSKEIDCLEPALEARICVP
jgi:hypothetical protein